VNINKKIVKNDITYATPILNKINLVNIQNKDNHFSVVAPLKIFNICAKTSARQFVFHQKANFYSS